MTELVPTSAEQLRLIHAMEQDTDTAPYILPTSLEQHQQAFARNDIIYLSIQDGTALDGYFILALDTDGISVELRRIVIAKKSHGTGQRALRALESWCREVPQRERIWLDVFDFNTRAQHVYTSLGYRRFDQREFEGKQLFFFEKNLASS